MMHKEESRKTRLDTLHVCIVRGSVEKIWMFITFVGLLLPRVMAQDTSATIALAPRGSSLDPSSYSNVEQFKPIHLSFEMIVDFDSSAVFGNVTHEIESLDGDTTIVYMDVWDAVVVKKAHFFTESTIDGCPSAVADVTFNISTPNPNIGNALDIELPCSIPVGELFYLQFEYETTKDNLAMSWMTPAQTGGKELPYMYSLCQMNFCRDFAPMMDTPSQKITYDATVITPNEFKVFMSANSTGSTPFNDTHITYSFNDTIKIPSYLIAIVVGDLEERNISDRVSIISEPVYLDAAVEEFSELPAVLDMTEEYLLPYVWGRYSIVVMPPSFPWGGMEHPLVTFATPTLVVGDKSKVSTAIHELTHSYFGNDVGCQNWDNLWINEGLNTFMERKILGKLRGIDYSNLAYNNGNISLYNDILDYGENNTYSSLFPNIGTDDPENSFNGLSYEKGSQFTFYMETLLGEDLMQLMLQQYLTNFSQMAIDQVDFKEFYEDFVELNFNSSVAAEIINLTDWNTWVLAPGLPPVALNFTTNLLDEPTQLVEEYLNLGGADSLTTSLNYSSFISLQKVSFVKGLQEAGDAVNAELLAIIDSDLNITSSTHPDIRTQWYILGITHGYDPVMDPAYQWMGEQGRNAYVRPTFSALVDAGMCDTAQAWFTDYELFYNSYVIGGVSRKLEECTSTEDPDISTPTAAPVTSGSRMNSGQLTGAVVTIGVLLLSLYLF